MQSVEFIVRYTDLNDMICIVTTLVCFVSSYTYIYTVKMTEVNIVDIN